MGSHIRICSLEFYSGCENRGMICSEAQTGVFKKMCNNYRWMDGWVGGWMGGWMDGWVGGWKEKEMKWYKLSSNYSTYYLTRCIQSPQRCPGPMSQRIIKTTVTSVLSYQMQSQRYKYNCVGLEVCGGSVNHEILHCHIAAQWGRGEEGRRLLCLNTGLMLYFNVPLHLICFLTSARRRRCQTGSLWILLWVSESQPATFHRTRKTTDSTVKLCHGRERSGGGFPVSVCTRRTCIVIVDNRKRVKCLIGQPRWGEVCRWPPHVGDCTRPQCATLTSCLSKQTHTSSHINIRCLDSHSQHTSLSLSLSLFLSLSLSLFLSLSLSLLSLSLSLSECVAP